MAVRWHSPCAACQLSVGTPVSKRARLAVPAVDVAMPAVSQGFWPVLHPVCPSHRAAAAARAPAGGKLGGISAPVRPRHRRRLHLGPGQLVPGWLRGREGAAADCCRAPGCTWPVAAAVIWACVAAGRAEASAKRASCACLIVSLPAAAAAAAVFWPKHQAPWQFKIMLQRHVMHLNAIGRGLE